jgi:uncharacterized protein YyaL (SSP411 family)
MTGGRFAVRILAAFVAITLGAGLLIFAAQRGSGERPPEEVDTTTPLNAPVTHGGRVSPPDAETIAKLPKNGGVGFNRLVFEKSPYLLQHARNPVDWYPWGAEAFEKAQRENKPVFLSVGYSTCHWCHVMEHESFEDAQVAALMNEFFVCIKVDREERPDIDGVYMTVTQTMTGRGGWPMTVVMTPDKKPFFAGTYFPKQNMLQLLPALNQAWIKDRDRVMQVVQSITSRLSEVVRIQPGGAMDQKTLDRAHAEFAQRHDSERGGFSHAPKFPVPHNMLFLLRHWHRTHAEPTIRMVEKTLTEMRRGGIFDHVGFGFHRYSTDKNWLVPHFEKMLYDQAMLTMAYVELYHASGKPEYARTAREILTYVLRDMTSPDGGFYSAEDADSEGEEGKFYVWDQQSVIDVLGEEDGKVFNAVYQISKGGNFHDEASKRRTGLSIPHLVDSLSESAAALDLDPQELGRNLEQSRQKLFDARERRIHPLKDDKILTDWNGLMIAAFAQAGRVLGEASYITAARRAAAFVRSTLKDDQGRLLKRYRAGAAAFTGHLEDYAYLVWGLLELYDATFDPQYLREAVELTDTMREYFRDPSGGFYKTATFSEKLLVRSKEVYDGARPSGNAVAALNLMRLSRLTGNMSYEKEARDLMRSVAGAVDRSPSHHAMMMCALDFTVGPTFEIVLAGREQSESMNRMLEAVRERYMPRKVVIMRTNDEQSITNMVSYTVPMTPIDDVATAYICRSFACDLPTTDVAAVRKALATGDRTNGPPVLAPR